MIREPDLAWVDRRRRAPAPWRRCAPWPRARPRSSWPPTTTARASSSAKRRCASCAATRCDAIPTTSPRSRRERQEGRRPAGRARAAPAAGRADGDDGAASSSRSCRRRWSTATTARATRRSPPTRSSAPSPSSTRSTSSSPRRPTRARTSTSSGAPCSRASCRWPATATAPSTSRSVACRRPHCACVVDRELERRAFVPVPYWEIKAELEAGGGERFEVAHAKGRFRPQPRPRGGAGRRSGRPAVVTAYATTPRTLRAAGAVQHDGAHERRLGRRHRRPRAPCAPPSRSTSTASSATRAPTTPSTRPRSTCAPCCSTLTAHAPVARSPPSSPTRPSSSPRRGKKRTTDHPPVYPVGVPKGELSGDQARSTTWSCAASWPRCCRPAVIEGQRLDVRLGSEPFVARGSRVAEPGFLRVYQQYTSNRERPAAAGRRRRRARRARPAPREQRDAAAVALRPGHPDRADGRARPGHQGDARRHHPAPLRPQLRARQPGGADRARHRPHRRLRRRHAERARSTSRRRR